MEWRSELILLGLETPKKHKAAIILPLNTLTMLTKRYYKTFLIFVNCSLAVGVIPGRLAGYGKMQQYENNFLQGLKSLCEN